MFVEPPDLGHKTELHTAVCKGKITLTQAQQAIVTDWTTTLAMLHLA